MNKLLTIAIIIFIGLFITPALLCMALGLGATLIAFMLNPKVMFALIWVLGILFLPGIIIGWIAKR